MAWRCFLLFFLRSVSSSFDFNRYALDVNVERAEDVITHKRVLQVAEDPVNRPAFEVILVQVHPTSDGNTPDVDNVDLSIKEDAQSTSTYNRSGYRDKTNMMFFCLTIYLCGCFFFYLIV
ncbi:hypothetical protein HanHA300_Chr14g0521761 [Helianthus annuus]|nr:hypothetical protein HanHA300_Chr14g0521761 [Helianthus annuus]KAJ0468324.1 hypothetical protein HanIR_Chr14g0695331 [Helianthus annuus]